VNSWRVTNRADPISRSIADRHYNRQKIGAPQFVPPGRCLVLLRTDHRALWVTSFPFAEYVRHAWAGAMVNSCFRNEGAERASDLIRQAVEETLRVWNFPPLGIVSFIDPKFVRPTMRRGTAIYGYSYLKAGWTHAGFTKAGLWVWQFGNQLTVENSGRKFPTHQTGAIMSSKKKAPKRAEPKSAPKKRRAPVQTTIPEQPGPETVAMAEIPESKKVKKLSTKIIVGKKIGKIEVPTRLYSVVGIATGAKQGESNYGVWTALTGQFEVRREDGAVFRAPQILLPDGALTRVLDAVAKLAGSVEFAMVIGAEPADTRKGYEYSVIDIIEPRASDQLAGLRNAVNAYSATSL
jgi:hypothetical protein